MYIYIYFFTNYFVLPSRAWCLLNIDTASTVSYPRRVQWCKPPMLWTPDQSCYTRPSAYCESTGTYGSFRFSIADVDLQSTDCSAITWRRTTGTHLAQE